MWFINVFLENFIYSYHLLKVQSAFLFFFVAVSGVSVIFSYGISTCFSGFIAKLLSFFSFLFFSILISFAFLSPKDTYNEIVKNRAQAKKTIENCKLSGLNAQQGGLFGVNKDEWTCPDGMKIFLPEKYRPQ